MDGDKPELKPPWVGERAKAIYAFRERMVKQVTQASEISDDNLVDMISGHFRAPAEEDVHRWRRFTFFDDIARMSDVLFRGPIEPRHADDVDMRLHSALARISRTISDTDVFCAAIKEYRVSSVHIAMLLETAKPPEIIAEGYYELPDARTLSGLLSLRCDKDDPEELLEIYRLICSKLRGIACPDCGGPLDEHTSAGFLDSEEALIFPISVPKIFVPHCGHAIHTLCFGHMLIPADAGFRGRCRACGDPFLWDTIDIEPMLNAFCLLFSPYIERKVHESEAIGEISQSAVLSVALFCRNFSDEMGGLVSPTSAWLTLSRRCGYEGTLLGDHVMEVLLPPPEHDDEIPQSRLHEDLSDGHSPEEEHITDLFLADAVEPELEDEISDHAPETESPILPPY